MQCTHPIRLGEGFVVPCGRCMACRVKRTEEWATRILHELSYWDCATFLTLTYDDDNVPIDGSLRKEELQLYLKRLRKRLDDRLIKYYAAGEYGDTTKRPHYHLIVFGVDPVKDKEVMDKSWSKGYIYVGTVTHDSSKYVSSYVQKLNGPVRRNMV